MCKKDMVGSKAHSTFLYLVYIKLREEQKKRKGVKKESVWISCITISLAFRAGLDSTFRVKTTSPPHWVIRNK